MLEKDNNTLKHNHREESMKIPSIIYADTECLLKKTNTRHNDPEK